MKTKLTFALIFLLVNTVLLAGGNFTTSSTGKDTLTLTSTKVSLPAAEEESYINDIPFDTKAIAVNSLFFNLGRPEAEEYINDIPFKTDEIFAIYNYNISNLHPEEEAYVDDIPFETSEVVENYKLSNCGFASRPDSANCEE